MAEDLVARLRKIAGHELDHMAAEAADELEQLRSVALAARALVQSAHDSLATDELETTVSDRALTALESALEAAGYGMTEEEFQQGVTDETKAGPHEDGSECHC